ncbi:carbohydrate sulfotransferase 14-like isoform X2 [Acropora millepora]|uniref:carbohydrate sulfotransferase 14-like isoform X2 n=1 Tax=Acropora millepora TaxID=45264 RepID=UPI001CF38595|nr:carbohydrate sulfotransferase 14-like isoform X2 [Acropora millepora]
MPSFHFIRVRHGDSTTFETCLGLQWETLLKEDLMWEHESNFHLRDDTKLEFTSADRIQAVEKVCGNKKNSWESLSAVQKQILAKHIIVNDEHRFLFCSVPKVACSNWKRVLMVLDGAESDSNNIGKVNHLDFTYLADLPPLAIKQRLKEYYKFMFVREPLERLTSAYKDKFVRNNTSFHKRYGRRIVKKLRKNPPVGLKGDDVTISEFFQYITESRMEEMNEHWMPYHMLCQPCAVSYDFIGSFENLESDATQVLKHLNIDEQVSFPKQQKWYKAGGKGIVTGAPKYTSVPKRLLKKVIDKYAIDYELFSYSTPSIEII